jgi:hypothetical protein
LLAEGMTINQAEKETESIAYNLARKGKLEEKFSQEAVNTAIEELLN